MTFKRKLKTSDVGADVSLDKPVYLVFPYSGGPMFGTETIGKHKETPVVTDTKINLNQICKGWYMQRKLVCVIRAASKGVALYSSAKVVAGN